MTDQPYPPQDDEFDTGFADEDIDVEAMEDFPTDEWDEDFEDDSPDAAGATVKTKRKSSGKLLYIIVGIFVLAVIGTLFIGKKPATITADNNGESALPVVENPIQIDELANAKDLPPQPAPINSATEEDTMQNPAPPSGVDIAQNTAQDIAEIPVVPPAKKLSKIDLSPPDVPKMDLPAATDMPALPQDTPPVPAPVATIQDNTAALAALTAQKEKEMDQKVSAVEKEWQSKFSTMRAEMTEKLNAAQDRIKDTQDKSKDSDKAVKSLQQDNDDLKAEIKALKAEKAKAKSDQAAAKTAAVPAPTLPVPTTAKPVAAPAASDAPILPTASDSDWILRSAQTGRALVSQKSTDSMKGVKVGDTLSGLGRIVSIALENGVWVVQGTTGKISR